ncbi:MAG: LPS export ABC transporter ATP-binding protein [Planctomycetota bacterium]|nr:LPS export ABC transporter ATP-binding protein [Planctomycetota bacterium]
MVVFRAPRRGELLLEARGLVKAYRGRRVVDGVHYRVAAGEIVGLLGPNGAGKTTSFRMTVGLVLPDAGTVMLNGAECTRLPMFRRARLGMGDLPQEASIFRRMSVRDNLLAVLETMPFNRRERKLEAERLMSELELTRLAKNMADTLSGGERRRLEMCRALATRPTILLLDEPFAGVDPINVQEIQGLVRQMREKDLGILITDHNVRETLQLTDRAAIIHEGRILREGTSAELVSDKRVREVYLGHSFDAPMREGGAVSTDEERELFGPDSSPPG